MTMRIYDHMSLQQCELTTITSLRPCEFSTMRVFDRADWQPYVFTTIRVNDHAALRPCELTTTRVNTVNLQLCMCRFIEKKLLLTTNYDQSYRSIVLRVFDPVYCLTKLTKPRT